VKKTKKTKQNRSVETQEGIVSLECFFGVVFAPLTISKQTGGSRGKCLGASKLVVKSLEI